MRIDLSRLDILVTHKMHDRVQRDPLHYELAGEVVPHIIPGDARYLGFSKDPFELFL